MLTRRRTFSPSPAKAAVSLGALSWFAFAPLAAFADLPITTVASFGNGSGVYPYSGVSLDSSGNLFGTTRDGGASGYGTVYEIVKGSSVVTTLASFTNTNGSVPWSGVSLDSSGNLFGTTQYGGVNNYGVVYEIASGTHNMTTLASFDSASGAYPYSGVTLDGSGNLFGATYRGGANGYGTVYEITKGSGAFSTLSSFNGTNGALAYGGITLDGSGNLFGTTYTGGAGGSGTVFEITKGSSAITDLVSFNETNGARPTSDVVMDSSGNIFGTTISGGSTSYGIVFEIAKGSSTLTNLYTFDGPSGAYPFGGVILDGSGNLFGTTKQGGVNSYGTVYKIAYGTHAFTSLASFNSTNGDTPYGGVVLDSKGNLFGTTNGGGAYNRGTVFEIAGAASPVPETSQVASLTLLLTGLTGLLLRARRRKAVRLEP